MSAQLVWSRLGQECLDAVGIGKLHLEDQAVQRAGQALADAAARLQHVSRIADLNEKIARGEQQIGRMREELGTLEADLDAEAVS